MTAIPIEITGDGLGAIAVASTLAKLGHPVDRASYQPAASPSGAVIVLSQKTLWMIGDLFGQDVLRDICCSGVDITARRLRWSEPAVRIFHENSLSVQAGLVADRLAQTIVTRPAVPVLTVNARGRPHNPGAAVGNVQAYVWRLPAQAQHRIDWCATLAYDRAWVALAPDADGHVIIQTYCLSGEADVARQAGERAVAEAGILIPQGLADAPVLLDATPRLGSLWDDASCAAGDEALALDPLAGDGVGHAIRAAIWLSGLLRARDLPSAMQQGIYSRRLRLAFLQHLMICERYYREMPARLAWRRQSDLIRRCIANLGYEPFADCQFRHDPLA